MSAYDEWSAEVLADVVGMIEQADTGAWVLPWQRIGHECFAPRNETTGAAYQGANIARLIGRSFKAGYASGRWATYKQWASIGAQVRKGEKGSTLVKWATVGEKADREAAAAAQPGEQFESRSRLVPRFFAVFAAEQVDGAPERIANPLSEGERIDQVEHLLKAIGADVRHGGDRACFIRELDIIHLPNFAAFTSALDYYSTSAHEHGHWTGPRLNRVLDSKRFGDESYACEELVAELTSVLFMAHCGLSTSPRPDHAQYVKSWLRAITDQPKALLAAMKMASDACAFLLKTAEANMAPAAPTWAAPAGAPAALPAPVLS